MKAPYHRENNYSETLDLLMIDVPDLLYSRVAVVAPIVNFGPGGLGD